MKRLASVAMAVAFLWLPLAPAGVAQQEGRGGDPAAERAPDSIRRLIREELEQWRGEIRAMVREEVRRALEEQGPGAFAHAGGVPPEAIQKMLQQRMGTVQSLVKKLRGGELPEGIALGEERGWLGVTLAELSPDQKQGELKETGGVRIASVLDGSPAEKAGLRKGDVVVRLDGKTVGNIPGIVEMIGARKPDQKVSIVVLREGRRIELQATLGKRESGISLLTPEIRLERGRHGARVEVEVSPSEPEAGEVPRSEDHRAPQGIVAGAGPWLGVVIQDLDDDTMRERDVDHGVLVLDVAQGSPAAAAGIAEEDVILAVGGKPVSDVDSLAERIQSLRVGSTVAIRVLHEGDRGEVSVRLGARPEQMEVEEAEENEDNEEIIEEAEQEHAETRQGREPGFLGVTYGPVDEGIAARAGIGPGGVQVTGIVPASPAETAGLEAGDVVLSVNNQKLEGVEALPATIRSFSAGDSVTITVARDGGTRTLTVTLGERPEEIRGAPATDLDRPVPRPRGATPAPQAESESPREASPPGAYLGVEVRPLGDETRRILGVPEGVGLVIARVLPGTPAASVLKEFDVLVGFNGEEVGTRDALARLVGEAHAGTRVALTILRKGRKVETSVELGSR